MFEGTLNELNKDKIRTPKENGMLSVPTKIKPPRPAEIARQSMLGHQAGTKRKSNLPFGGSAWVVYSQFGSPVLFGLRLI